MRARALPSRRELFMQKFMATFLPMLLAVLLLGAVSAVLLLRQVVDSAIQQSNNMLMQAMQSIEMIFSSVDTVALAVCQDTSTLDRISEVFENESYVGRESIRESERFRKFVSSTANSIPYILSVHVYIQNSHGKFMTTDATGVTTLDQYFDTAWFESYQRHRGIDEVWTESRSIRRYSFEQPVELISRYRSVYPLGMVERGVIVENVEKRKILTLLDGLTLLPSQRILVLDDCGQTLLDYTQSGESLPGDAARQLRTEIPSERFGWTYVSVVPHRVLYRSASYLLRVLLGILLCGFLFSFAAAIFVTRHKYQRALSVIRAIDSRSPSAFAHPEKKPDEYDYFLESMLQEYMEKTNLELTVSAQQYQLRIMEILALQSQINPHFLFNTLEVIKWESIGLTRGENVVSQMLEDLADIMRYALSDPHEMVTLREELEVTRSYVKILQSRYVDKFEVDWRCDPALGEILVPKLIFQPLIENSVYHGIKEKPGFRRIRVRIHLSRGALLLRVCNNGCGMTRERLSQVRRTLEAPGPADRIGLYNIVKRLSLLFPGACSVRIFSRETLGTTVAIRIAHFNEERGTDLEKMG